MRKLARLSFNASGWQRPTPRNGRGDSAYVRSHGFGHEDWLFRFDWLIDGWRYGFIQGVNKGRKQKLKQPLELTLFTTEPNKKRRFVCNLHELECLDDDHAEAARDIFIENGWLDVMRGEVEAIGGNPDGLEDEKAAFHILNVRFRPENRDVFPKESYIEDRDGWFAKRKRMQLFNFPPVKERAVAKEIHRRMGKTVLRSADRIFRRGARSSEYDPVHQRMQQKLFSELKRKFGSCRVVMEEDFVDVKVTTKGHVLLYEIKTDLNPKAVIRQALGQILEYAYYPPCRHQLPVRMVLVGRTRLSASDREYLGALKARSGLEVEYHVVDV